MVIARKTMAAWFSDSERRPVGIQVDPGDVCLVVQSWMVGANVRLRLIARGTMSMFSCRLEHVRLNWTVVQNAE
jgi:hypothetical protein